MTADAMTAVADPVTRGPVSDSTPAVIGGSIREATARLEAAGLPTARLDAECLLARAMGMTRLGLYVDAAAPVPPAAVVAFADTLARRADQEPLQYITGEVEFHGLELTVGPGVFIPRPETEGLVDTALALGPAGPATVLDLCSGSGAVACALAAARPAWVVWAVELSPVAAACARVNVRRLGLEARVRLLDGDLVTPLAGRGLERGCNLIVANPPYLATAVLPALPREVRDWEPVLALDGGPDGTAIIQRILAAAPALLRVGEALLVEIGEEQGPALRARLAADSRYAGATIHRDLMGRERVLEARRA